MKILATIWSRMKDAFTDHERQCWQVNHALQVEAAKRKLEDLMNKNAEYEQLFGAQGDALAIAREALLDVVKQANYDASRIYTAREGMDALLHASMTAVRALDLIRNIEQKGK